MTKSFKIGSAVAALAIVAGLIFFFSRLQSQVSSKDDEIQRLTAEKTYMAWQWSIDKDKLDTLKNVGEYIDTDTLWRTRIRIDTLPGEIDTVYEFIGDIKGVIRIDTGKAFGPGPDSLKIQVEGRLYYPEEFADRSWLLIYREPGSGKPPDLPPSKSCPTKSIGIMMAFNSNSELMGLAKFQYKRFSVYGGYSIPGKYYLTGMGLRLIKW